MRIGIDAAILPPSTRHSGIGRYVARLSEQFARQAEHSFVLFAPQGTKRPRDLPPQLEWCEIPVPRLGKLSMLAAYWWQLPRLAAAADLDVFHAPTVHPRPTWPPVPRRMPCPIVVTVHDLIPLTHYRSGADRLPRRQSAFYRWNLRAATAAARIITVSEASRREIMAELGVAHDRITAVYNGVDASPATRVPRIASTRPPYALFVGSFEPRKNLLAAIRAFGQIAGELPSHQLIAVADPRSGSSEAVHHAIASLGIGQRVRFVSNVSDDELWTLYAGAEMFVFPSLAEGFGLPPLEAMAAGTPVIASGLPAHREVLGDAAILADPRSTSALAEAMLRVARSPELRTAMAARGRERAACFSWRTCARQTLDVYRAATGAPDTAADDARRTFLGAR